MAETPKQKHSLLQKSLHLSLAGFQPSLEALWNATRAFLLRRQQRIVKSSAFTLILKGRMGYKSCAGGHRAYQFL